MITETNYFWNIIERAQRGNKNSFFELAGMFKDKIYSHAVKLTGDTVLARKVTTKLFTKAWQHIRYLNENSPFELWLSGLTVSIVAAYYRKRKDNNEPFYENGAQNIISESNDSNDFDKQYMSLYPLQRLVLYLHDFLGYSIEDCMVMFGEKQSSKILEELDTARRKFTDMATIELLNSITDNEWSNFIQDFEYWKVEEHPLENMTDTVKSIYNYRVILANLISSVKSPENILDDLKNSLFEESEIDHNARKRTLHDRIEELISSESRSSGGLKIAKDSLTKNIEETLADPNPKEKLHQRMLSNKKKNRIFIYSFILVFTIIDSAFLVGTLFKKQTFPWTLEPERGTITVNGGKYAGELRIEDNITSESGSPRVNIPDIGSITLYPGAKIKILKGDEDDNQIQLESGTIELNTKIFYHRLTVKTFDSDIHDFGSKALLTLTDDKQLKAEVFRGGTRIYSKGKLIPVFEEYSFNEISFLPSHAELMLTDNLLYEDGKSFTEGSIEAVLKENNKRIAPVLFSLIQMTDKNSASRIFDKLNQMISIPDGVTKSGILNGDIKMLNKWLDEIEFRI